MVGWLSEQLGNVRNARRAHQASLDFLNDLNIYNVMVENGEDNVMEEIDLTVTDPNGAS